MESKFESTDWTKVSEIDLVYLSKVRPSERPTVLNSKKAYDLFISYWDMGKIELMEKFKCMFLNRANRVLGIYELSTGGISGTVADSRLVFAAALKLGSSKIIISHNHPSGNLKPSKEDENLTARLKEGGRLLDIPILDHLIITREGYFSFADEGLL